MARRKPRRDRKHNRNRDDLPALADRPTLWSIIRSRRFRFVAAFVLSCIAVYVLISALPDRYLGLINEDSARTLGLVLNSIGIPVSVAGDIVSGSGFAIRIMTECTPAFMVGLFVCFIVFSPATFRQKALGLAVGIPALYLGNVIRLIAIFIVSLHDKSLFEAVHAFWGQTYTIFLVLLCFILWLKWIDRKESPQSGPAKAAIFLTRFTVIAGCLFLLWMKIHHGYIWFVDQFMVFGFSLFDYHINLARNNAVYYETFSMVTFTSLVLSARSMSGAMKIKALAVGLVFLFATHLFHRIDNALMASFHYTAAQPVDESLLIIGGYLLPVVFLIYLIRYQKSLAGTESTVMTK